MRVKSLEPRAGSQKRSVALRSHSSSRPSTLDSRPPRRGLTLIELLVVIIILTTIVAAAIPIMSPANDDRRLREAARGLNTFITGAQTRTIASGRPYGIALKRLAQDTNPNPISNPQHEDNAVCLELFYVEQPPPYAGFDHNSRAMVALHPTRSGKVAVRFATRGPQMASGFPVGWNTDLFPTGMIRPGDVIEIQGTRFELLDHRREPGGNDPLAYIPLDDLEYYNGQGQNARLPILAQPLNNSGQQINPRYDNTGAEIGSGGTVRPFWTAPAPYKILRQPKYASDQPYQLPEGTAIDLRASGLGVNDYFYVPGKHDNNKPVMIMFSPEGKISRLHYYQTPINNDKPLFDEPVTDNLYLLVGKRENCPAPALPDDRTLNLTAGEYAAMTDQQRAKLREPINWLSGFSRWVVIGPQSGRIVTIENAFVPLDLPQIMSTAPNQEAMRNAQILAAREFTREMRQLGGR